MAERGPERKVELGHQLRKVGHVGRIQLDQPVERVGVEVEIGSATGIRRHEKVVCRPVRGVEPEESVGRLELRRRVHDATFVLEHQHPLGRDMPEQSSQRFRVEAAVDRVGDVPPDVLAAVLARPPRLFRRRSTGSLKIASTFASGAASTSSAGTQGWSR